jgi:hypothetical protein
MEIKEFQYPDGWYMRVGQVYSSPYESYHVRITRIDQLNDEEQVIFFDRINPKDYSELWSDEEDFAYSWWFNQGHWDLEKEPKDIY